MERKKNIILFLLTITTLILPMDYDDFIYKAYTSNNMQLWYQKMNELANVAESKEDYEKLVNYEYGYIAYCLSNKKYELAETILNNAKKHLQKYIELKGDLSSYYAYEAAFYGYEIGLSKWKAPILGSKSKDAADNAVKTNNNNYLGYIQLGNIEFYKPKIFGGSAEIALKYYLIAKNLMINKKDWNYLNLLITIAEAYEKLGKINEAKIILNEAINIDNNFKWALEKLKKLERKNG